VVITVLVARQVHRAYPGLISRRDSRHGGEQAGEQAGQNDGTAGASASTTLPTA
jgi:hypothetical protein